MDTAKAVERGAAAAIAALLLFLSGIAAPEALAQRNPKKMLDRAEKALGEKKTFQKIETVIKRGLITRFSDGATGEVVLQASKPDLYNISFDIRGFEYETGFNGRSGWVRDSREGLRTLTGDLSRDLKAEALYRNWLWTEYGKQKFKITGTESITLDGTPTIAVTITNPQGVPIKMYFDAFSNTLLREEISSGEGLVSFDYADYRPVNGVREAFEINAIIGGTAYLMKFDQVIHNGPIDADEFNFPVDDGAPLPDIPELLKEIQRNQEEIERILEDYSYKQQIIKRELTDEGELKIKDSETFQLSFYKGYRIQRLIAKDGRPLTPEEQRDADEKAQDRVKDIEKELAKQEERTVDQSSTGAPDRDGRQISIAEVLKASKLLNPRRERLKGRKVVVFDFEPDPDFDFSNAKSFLKFFGKTAGVMWIDEEDKQVARIEAVLFDSYKVGGGILAKLRKGASFTLEQERINDEIWLPTFADINLSVRVLLFGGVKVNQVIRSFDFNKFRTEVEDARLDEIKQDDPPER